MFVEELSAVVLLQRILDDALLRSASDVHLRHAAGLLQVAFRVDGQVEPFLTVPDPAGTVIRRVKALGRMDVSESRLPQDGAFSWHLPATDDAPECRCDVRAAVVPMLGGEAAVLRLLAHSGDLRQSLLEIGMTELQRDRILHMLSRPAGLILVAGATGSGKTTTLYAMLQELVGMGRRVVSIEDPVEIPMSTWQQMEVRERIGVTFDVGLRALLRQDPDAIMIGEIRDDQTARVAVRAALTGHIVLSTTHARDTVGAAVRLVDFGVARELLCEVLLGVVVQDLTVEVDHNLDPIDSEWSVPAQRRRLASFRISEMDRELSAQMASGVSWATLRDAFADRLRASTVAAGPPVTILGERGKPAHA